jgi:hypothetical protein
MKLEPQLVLLSTLSPCQQIGQSSQLLSGFSLGNVTLSWTLSPAGQSPL